MSHKQCHIYHGTNGTRPCKRSPTNKKCQGWAIRVDEWPHPQEEYHIKPFRLRLSGVGLFGSPREFSCWCLHLCLLSEIIAPHVWQSILWGQWPLYISPQFAGDGSHVTKRDAVDCWEIRKPLFNGWGWHSRDLIDQARWTSCKNSHRWPWGRSLTRGDDVPDGDR